METAYVGNDVSSTEASTTVGTEVIKAVAQKYQTNNQIGKANIEIEDFGTIENVTGDATVTVSTTDFEIIGTITFKGGNLLWGEIEPNVPAVLDRVELSPTTLDIEQGGSGAVEVKCYNSSNNLIPTRKLRNLVITKKNGSDNITVTQIGTNKASITVNEIEDIGEKAIAITTTANNTSIDTEIIINVIQKEAIVGQFVEYNVGYTDISTNASDEPNSFEFSPLNGWRILELPEQTKQSDESYKTTTVSGTTYYVKIISTGIPGGLYYSTAETNNGWWDNDTSLNKKIRVANGLSTPSKFETIVFNRNTVAEAYNDDYKNQGYYTQIKHYTDSTTGKIVSETITNSQTAEYLFKLDGIAAEVDTLTLDELNAALNNSNSASNVESRNANSTDSLNSTNDSRGLFYLYELGNTYKYSTDTKNCYYWLATPASSGKLSLAYVRGNSLSLTANTSCQGLRPVVALSSNVYIKKNNTTGRWEIKNVIN
ncbi:MAG: hypothetical protein IJH76_01160 [Clostridia bacterium]|nr:hypothetical protein [Clostridia bacterium]